MQAFLANCPNGQVEVDGQCCKWGEVVVNGECVCQAKLYIPSTLNIDLILWHTQLIVCVRKC